MKCIDETHKIKAIIYGTGIEAEKFLYKYHDKYDIGFYIDSLRAIRNRGGHRFHGKKVIWFKILTFFRLINSVLDGKLLIICGNYGEYIYISNILKASGLIEFDNYIWSNFIDRDVAIFYGNCHMEVIADCFKNNPEFNSKYYTHYFFVGEGDTNRRYPSDSELQHAKIVVTMDIREGNMLSVPDAETLRHKIKNGCKFVVIPNLWGRNLFWMQTDWDRSQIQDYLVNIHLNNNAIVPDNNKKQNIKGLVCGIIEWRDHIIENNGKKDVNDIADIILHDQIWDEESIRENFNTNIEKIRKREEHCDIKISDFIEDNYKTMQLFYDAAHPSNELLYEKVRRIAEKLNIQFRNEIKSNIFLDNGEIFIYGCVRSALGIKWKQDLIRQHKSWATLDDHAITLNEYIFSYLKWIREVDDISVFRH